MKANAPVDRDNQPLAWYTYAALRFLEDRCRSDMDVFEFGAGNSTLWWAARARSVASVESDKSWVERLNSRLPSHASVKYQPLDTDGEYAHSVLKHDKRFDIVVVDGFDRNNCARRALSALTDDGIIVWDNTDWVELFQEGMDMLEREGFKRLDFGGIGPLNGYGWVTSVFYRPGRNCFEI